MRRITKYLLLIAAVACHSDREPLDTMELKQEFENNWWEPINNPLTNKSDGIMCLNFNSKMYKLVDPPIDGKVLYFTEADWTLSILSVFERTDEGYYLPNQNADVEILVDDEGNYIAKVKVGILSDSSVIIPCSLN
jgi:hypothetical protein